MISQGAAVFFGLHRRLYFDRLRAASLAVGNLFEWR
jgi:hypothetical protein